MSGETRPEARTKTPPAAPGPGATPWRCRCGNLLGIVCRDWLHARHRGRSVAAALPARVQWEACGRTQARVPTRLERDDRLAS